MLDRRLFALPNAWRERTRWHGGRLPRRDGAANRLLNLLPYYTVITVGAVARRLAVSAQAANVAVAALVDADLPEERTGWKRHRVFALSRGFGPDRWLQGVAWQDRRAHHAHRKILRYTALVCAPTSPPLIAKLSAFHDFSCEVPSRIVTDDLIFEVGQLGGG
jgi:hypothetical protein